MRFARVEIDGQERVGVVQGESTLRLFPEGVDLLSVATAREAPAEDAKAISLEGVRLLPPIRPASFRDFVAFEEHVQGAAAMTGDAATAIAVWYAQPTYLYGSPHAIVGSGEPVAAPPGSTALDFELEVGVVIGRDGRNLTPDEATDHIAGYLVVNDWSARDIQGHEMKGGLGPAKAKDFATTIGPWLVTPDELEPARNGNRLDLRMQVSINGTHFGSDSLAHMGWSFEELVSYASRSAWVRAGDLIASGTCSGGSLAERWGRTGRREPAPLQPGDIVTMTVDRLGTIANPVVAAEPERSPIRPATPLAELKRATAAQS
jgi:2-keto-4-pentenoate hydratase/2-oxohepta-3-ene-1,7-dioic acid hydratase in catechol pathway